MKRLKITNDHGWTPRKLRQEERKIKNVFLRQHVMAVLLVMEEYLGKEVTSMLNLCRQSVAFYVSLFNEGGLDLLVRSETSAGPGAVFDAGTATGTETDHLDPHPRPNSVEISLLLGTLGSFSLTFASATG